MLRATGACVTIVVATGVGGGEGDHKASSHPRPIRCQGTCVRVPCCPAVSGCGVGLTVVVVVWWTVLVVVARWGLLVVVEAPGGRLVVQPAVMTPATASTHTATRRAGCRIPLIWLVSASLMTTA